MPSKYQHPALTVEGWTSSSIQVADQMLSDFYLSEYSQTAMWPGDVKSFPWLLQRYADDPVKLADQTQEMLKAYLLQQFMDVEVEVLSQPVETNSSVHSLSFFITFYDSTGEMFNLSRLLRYNNLKIVEISTIMKG